MLKKFSVKNYKGFKDQIAFDFSEYRDYGFNKQAIKSNLINTAVIYGKNSSGKSNFGLALFDITLHLVDKQQHIEQRMNYLNADSIEKYATFRYQFVFDNKDITYEYLKNEQALLIQEVFYINSDKIFQYDFTSKRGDFAGLKKIGLENVVTNATNMNISVLRYLAKNTNMGVDSEIAKVMHFVDHMLWFKTAQENQYIGLQRGGDDILSVIINDGKVKDFENFLHKAGIDLELVDLVDPTGIPSVYAKFENRSLNFWQIASNGTKAITLYYFWLQRIKDASFVFIDEFDAFFHTILAETLLKDMMTKIQSQFMITTHNTDLMSNTILRPDCYFILSEGRLFSLPNCTERELREGHNLEKMFKNGEFSR